MLKSEVVFWKRLLREVNFEVEIEKKDVRYTVDCSSCIVKTRELRDKTEGKADVLIAFIRASGL